MITAQIQKSLNSFISSLSVIIVFFTILFFHAGIRKEDDIFVVTGVLAYKVCLRGYTHTHTHTHTHTCMYIYIYIYIYIYGLRDEV